MDVEHQARDYMQPGPHDSSLLRLQHCHRSQAIWYDQIDQPLLKCRRASSVLHNLHLDDKVEPYVRQAGFDGVARLGFFQLDWHLITALVERWRPETHTFHLPEGECTITLQDVAIQTGLPIDGAAVTGIVRQDWKGLCHRLLGIMPPNNAIRGAHLKLSWLSEQFSHLPNDANDITIQCHARAFILRIIGGVIFPDKSTSRVNLMFLPLLDDFHIAGQYSWGGACLAWLYRELCNATDPKVAQISGALILLQIWAWDRFPSIASTLKNCQLEGNAPLGKRWSNARVITEVSTHVLKDIRHALDRQRPDEIVWEPYTDDILQTLPEHYLRGRAIWRVVVPLICFHIVEWHQPDRVMRQFGLQQPIPLPPKQTDELHSVGLQKLDTNWATFHSRWITLWNDRATRVVSGPAADSQLHYHSEYMEWYRRVTRRWISHVGAAMGVVADGIETALLCTRMPTSENMDIMHRTVDSMLAELQEKRRICTMLSPQPAPDPPSYPVESDVASLPIERSTGRKRRQCTLTERQREVSIPPLQPCEPVPCPVSFHSQHTHSSSESEPDEPPFMAGPSSMARSPITSTSTMPNAIDSFSSSPSATSMPATSTSSTPMPSTSSMPGLYSMQDMFGSPMLRPSMTWMPGPSTPWMTGLYMPCVMMPIMPWMPLMPPMPSMNSTPLHSTPSTIPPLFWRPFAGFNTAHSFVTQPETQPGRENGERERGQT